MKRIKVDFNPVTGTIDVEYIIGDRVQVQMRFYNKELYRVFSNILSRLLLE